jgi:hypothetical protein
MNHKFDEIVHTLQRKLAQDKQSFLHQLKDDLEAVKPLNDEQKSHLQQLNSIFQASKTELKEI